jgi:hypothetical protein
MAERGVVVQHDSRQWRIVLQLVQRALVERCRRDVERWHGSFGDHSFDALFNGVTGHTPPEPAQQQITLGALVEKFKVDPARANRRDITAASYEFTFRMLREVVGDTTPVRRITRADCRRVRDLLLALPPNATKRFPKLTLGQAAEHTKAHGLSPLNIQTAQKHMSQMAALFNWATGEEYTERSPGKGLTIASAGPKGKARRPYAHAKGWMLSARG